MTFIRSFLIIFVAWLVLTSPWLVFGATIPWDAKAHWYPHLVFLSENWMQGLWNPHIFAGSPEIADPQSAYFLLPLFLTALLVNSPSLFAFDLSIFLMILAGMTSVLWLFRYKNWKMEGAVIAAISFGFGASMAWRVQHVNQVTALCLLPLIWVLIEKTIAEKSWRFGILTGVVAAFLTLIRDQVSLLIVYWLVILTLVLLVHTKGKGFLQLALGGVITLLILVIPFYLTLTWAEMSNRPEIDLISAGRGSFHPLHFFSLFIANLFNAAGEFKFHWGTPSLVFPDTGLFVARNMNVIYSGALPCLLLLMGFWKRIVFQKEIRFITFSMVFFTFYALGWYSPLFEAFYSVVPFIKNFRRPADATFLMGGFMSIIAGFVWNELQNRKIALGYLIFVGLVLVSALALSFVKATLFSTYHTLLIASLLWGLVFFTFNKPFWVIIAVLIGDLLWSNSASESTALPKSTYEMLDKNSKNELIVFLKNNLKPLERIELRGLGYHFQNASMVHGFHDILGFNPLRGKDYSNAVGTEDIASLMEQRRFPDTFKDYNAPLADALGLRFVVAGKPIEGLNQVFHNKDGYVYERKSALPRAIFPDGAVKITRYSNTVIELEAVSQNGGLVTLHDAFHPWWEVNINGKPATILKTNLIFRGVEIPAGTVTIHFRFNPLKAFQR